MEQFSCLSAEELPVNWDENADSTERVDILQAGNILGAGNHGG